MEHKDKFLNKLIKRFGGYTKEEYNVLKKINSELNDSISEKNYLIRESNKNYESLEHDFKTLKATMKQYKEEKHIPALKGLNERVSDIRINIWAVANDLQAMVEAEAILDKDVED